MICAGGAVERDGEARHALLRYDSAESLCARAVPYVREGLARGEAVLAVVSAEVEQVLGSALGDAAAGVGWQPEDVSYGRLGVMFEGFRRFLAEQRAAGVPMRLLAQNDTIGTKERMAAYLRFEAMANEVYRPYGYRWACLYDTRAHSTQMLRQVSQVHPRLLDPGGREIHNDDYLEPGAYLVRPGCGCREPGHLMRPAGTRGRGRRAGLVGARGWRPRIVAGCRLRAGADRVIGAVGGC